MNQASRRYRSTIRLVRYQNDLSVVMSLKWGQIAFNVSLLICSWISLDGVNTLVSYLTHLYSSFEYYFLDVPRKRSVQLHISSNRRKGLGK